MSELIEKLRKEHDRVFNLCNQKYQRHEPNEEERLLLGLLKDTIAALSSPQPVQVPNATQGGAINPFHPNSFEHAYWQQGWDARGRAPQPVPVAAKCENCETDLPKVSCGYCGHVNHAAPVAAEAEAKFEELLEELVRAVWSRAIQTRMPRDGQWYNVATAEADALRQHFKQSLSAQTASVATEPFGYFIKVNPEGKTGTFRLANIDEPFPYEKYLSEGFVVTSLYTSAQGGGVVVPRDDLRLLLEMSGMSEFAHKGEHYAARLRLQSAIEKGPEHGK